MFKLCCVALVSFGKVTAEQKQAAENAGLAMYSWAQFLQLVGTCFELYYFGVCCLFLR